MTQISMTPIPTRWIGPLYIESNLIKGFIDIPLATYETPLWPSVARGAKISRLVGGIQVTLKNDVMTRSILLEAPTSHRAWIVSEALQQRTDELADVVTNSSRYAQFKSIAMETVGPLLFIRLTINSGAASGHNMTTKAAEDILKWIIHNFNDIQEVSVSGNYCTDKKVSAVNGLLGRGKNVTAEIIVPRDICERLLRTTPQQIVDLNHKKNYVGSTLAGSLRSANAHYANMLLALYLATGQDAANIIEGSQGMTYATVSSDGALQFSVNLPNIIVGVVGHGKHHDFVKANLHRMQCNPEDGQVSAQRLAIITAAAVLCGELSLMAALTNSGELLHTHVALERHEHKTTDD